MRTDRAARDIRKKKTEYISDAAQRQKIGQIEDAQQTAEYQDVLQQEADLTAGHGVLRATGFVAVSANDPDELERAVAAIEQAAIQASCETRRLWGQQAQAFAAAASPAVPDRVRKFSTRVDVVLASCVILIDFAVAAPSNRKTQMAARHKVKPSASRPTRLRAEQLQGESNAVHQYRWRGIPHRSRSRLPGGERSLLEARRRGPCLDRPYVAGAQRLARAINAAQPDDSPTSVGGRFTRLRAVGQTGHFVPVRAP